MKQYKVLVNGQAYDVSVEEVGASPQAGNRMTSPAPVATPAAAPVATPVAAPVPTAPVQAVSAPVPGALTVKAPMPGTVMSFKVTVGQEVKRGDVLLILEAMKMENEIVAPQAGKVASLRVPVSASVNTGDPLVDLA